MNVSYEYNNWDIVFKVASFVDQFTDTQVFYSVKLGLLFEQCLRSRFIGYFHLIHILLSPQMDYFDGRIL